jgi:hypothetical protein
VPVVPPSSRGADANPHGLALALGCVAWTVDPRLCGSTASDTSGTLHGGGVYLTAGQVITRLAEYVVTGGTGMTHGFLCVYSLDGATLYAQTADFTAAWQATGAWAEAALTAPWTVPVSGGYAFCDVLATGTTMPTVLVGETGNGARNTLPSGSNIAINPANTGLIAPPASFTPGNSSFVRCIVAR